jgi:hypothetical protein
MPDRFRRVPLASEVHTFQTEISGREQIVTGRKPQNSAVVANSGHYIAIFCRVSSAQLAFPHLGKSRLSGGSADSGNERSFRQGQDEPIINAEGMGSPKLGSPRASESRCNLRFSSAIYTPICKFYSGRDPAPVAGVGWKVPWSPRPGMGHWPYGHV